MRPKTAHALRGSACTLCDVIKYGFFQQVRLLISTGINTESRDEARRTPLILCAFLEPEEWGASIAMTLIENGVRVARRDCFGRNVLHYACIFEREKLVRVLLKAIDFDLNQSDKMGNTALHYASMSGNVIITQLIAHSFKRYRISPNKINHHGKTASEEAFYAGNSACGHAIQLELSGRNPGSAMKDVRFADEVRAGSNSSRPGSQNSSLVNNRRALRPLSAAFLTRRDSSSTINSADERRSPVSYRSRSSLSLPANGFTRKAQNPLYAYGYKKDTEVIHCAPKRDFRNKPDYVFKLVHLPFSPEWEPTPYSESTNRTCSSWNDTSSTSQSLAVVNVVDWRRDLKQLFQVYENQCSPSWRASKAVPVPEVVHDPSCPGPDEEEKGRRGRRPSVPKNVHSHGKEAPDIKRRPSVARIRRMTSSVGKMTSSMDGSLDTSSESINSLASSKRRGLDKDVGQGRPESVMSKSKTKLSRDLTSPAASPSPSPSPPLGHSLSPPTVSTLPHTKPFSSSPEDVKGDVKNTKRKGDTSPLPPIAKHNGPSPLSASKKQNINLGNESLNINGAAKPMTNGASPEGQDTEMREANNNIVLNNGNRSTAPRIPQLRETLVPDSRHLSNVGSPQLVDPNRLWVQNPYEDDDEEDEDDS